VDETAIAIPDELARAAAGRGWPEGLLQRALELRMPREVIARWLSMPWTEASFVEARLKWHERLTFGDLRGREATLADNEAFSELFANAPEEVGQWEITTERGPNAFAQFRLQENVNVLVIEKEGRLIAACSFSHRKTIAGGKRVMVRYGQALRVHKDYRRQGYGDQVRSLPWGAFAARNTHGQYDIMRSQNFAVVNWWKKYMPDFWEGIPQREGEVPGIPVTVLQFPARPPKERSAGIRKAQPADIARCVSLINRTHRGLDLFRPYSVDFLQNRLDDGIWGEQTKEVWNDPWRHVYGWDDYYVLEEQGRVVACAGLWDRGRDMRDRYRHTETGEEKVVTVAAVLDFGYARGHEATMARLVGYLIGETNRLGRDFLAVPLDYLPALAQQLARYEPAPETRALRWGLQDYPIERPHIDLAYW